MLLDALLNRPKWEAQMAAASQANLLKELLARVGIHNEDLAYDNRPVYQQTATIRSLMAIVDNLASRVAALEHAQRKAEPR